MFAKVDIERSIDSRRLDLLSVFYGHTRIFVAKDGLIATITAEGSLFESELATVGGRTDELESRTVRLEDNQFSSTAKLTGETVLSFSDTFNVYCSLFICVAVSL